jgi:hypothetical protein
MLACTNWHHSQLQAYKKHNPQTALIAVVNPTPLRPRNLAIVCCQSTCPLFAEQSSVVARDVNRTPNYRDSSRAHQLKALQISSTPTASRYVPSAAIRTSPVREAPRRSWAFREAGHSNRATTFSLIYEQHGAGAVQGKGFRYADRR